MPDAAHAGRRQVTIGKQRWRTGTGNYRRRQRTGRRPERSATASSILVSGRDGGSGLGLTLAQTFVQQHQGDRVDSEPGKTLFKIMILP